MGWLTQAGKGATGGLWVWNDAGQQGALILMLIRMQCGFKCHYPD